MDLSKKKCVPCEGGVEPLKEDKINIYLSYLSSPWNVIDNKKIQNEFKFKNFKEAMQFVNKIADIANEEEHHPDLYLFYNKVKVELSTHAISGLSENDFIMAGKIEKIINI